jgi:sugar/nucleoside kinase (ribokinase family)
MKEYEVLGIGAAIVDSILHVSESFLAKIPGRKGGMESISGDQFQAILNEYSAQPTFVPGGSAANVIRGLANLGNRCAFHCKVGPDAVADSFLKDLQNQGIRPILTYGNSATAQVISLVTPDGQRTCRSYLGAASEMRGSDFIEEEFKNVRLVHIEGYTLSYNDLTETAMKIAKKAGAKISLDLASFEIVEKHQETILELLKNYVDILLANQDEASVLTGLAPEQACECLRKICPIVVISMNKNGSRVGDQNSQFHCPAYPVIPIDSTGAGDLFASGFLHGYLKGKSLQECAHYGALLGAAVVQVEGAELSSTVWDDFRKKIEI